MALLDLMRFCNAAIVSEISDKMFFLNKVKLQCNWMEIGDALQPYLVWLL